MNRAIARYLRARGHVQYPANGAAWAAHQQAGFSTASIIVLLHEFAHLVVDSAHPDFLPWRDAAQTALAKLTAANQSLLTGATTPRDWQLLAGMPLEELDQAPFQEQLALYIDTVTDNGALEREVTCDFVAAVAFLNLGAGSNLFYAELPETLTLSPNVPDLIREMLQASPGSALWLQLRILDTVESLLQKQADLR